MVRGERQRATAGDKTRGGAAQGSPEKAIPAFPWLIRAEVWLWSMPVARVSYLGPRRGPAGCWTAHTRTVAGLRVGDSPACGVRAIVVLRRGRGELVKLTQQEGEIFSRLAWGVAVL